MSEVKFKWNTKTKRLEFNDGTPVGALPLNAALEARGKPRMKKHLQETKQCAQRRVEEAAALKLRYGHATEFQKYNENFVKPNSPRHRLGPTKPGVSYRAGILDTMED